MAYEEVSDDMEGVYFQMYVRSSAEPLPEDPLICDELGRSARRKHTPNMEFIANARTDIPALLAYVEYLETRLDVMEGKTDKARIVGHSAVVDGNRLFIGRRDKPEDDELVPVGGYGAVKNYEWEPVYIVAPTRANAEKLFEHSRNMLLEESQKAADHWKESSGGFKP